MTLDLQKITKIPLVYESAVKRKQKLKIAKAKIYLTIERLLMIMGSLALDNQKCLRSCDFEFQFAFYRSLISTRYFRKMGGLV